MLECITHKAELLNAISSLGLSAYSDTQVQLGSNFCASLYVRVVSAKCQYDVMGGNVECSLIRSFSSASLEGRSKTVAPRAI
jgi:hypothetical protein